MKTITLTQGKVALVDDADYDELSKYKWSFNGRYAQRHDPATRRPITMHRHIMQPAPGQDVDHRNGNKLDYQRANLRLATRAENCRNRRLPRTNTSGYKGAQLIRKSGRWQGRIKMGGKFYALGTFDTAEAAGRAYDAAARSLWGDFAKLNFPGGALGASASSMSTE